MGRENKTQSQRPRGGTPHFEMMAQKAGTPLRKQIESSPCEWERYPRLESDPLQEARHCPTPFLIHRYPRTVLILVTRRCFAYCRFCFRRNWAYADRVEQKTVLDAWDPIRSYLVTHPEIREVVLSGGDPLTLNNTQIEDLLARIRAVKPTDPIRIATRAPVFDPDRLDSTLLDVLQSQGPISIYVHVNHPGEISREFEQFVCDVKERNVSCFSQTVLLRGVNDCVATLESLFWRLYCLGVHPSYLHLCDRVAGTQRFLVDLKTANILWRSLWGRLPGAAIPHFVFDDGGRLGKTPLTDQVTVVYADGSKIVSLCNQKQILYPEPFDGP